MTISAISGQRYQKAKEALEALENLQEIPSDRILEVLRFLKNSIIGNPTRKRFYLKNLGMAPR